MVEKLTPKSVQYLSLERKLIANMTTESWEATPHAGGNYEPDVTEFWDTFQALRKSDSSCAGITATRCCFTWSPRD